MCDFSAPLIFFSSVLVCWYVCAALQLHNQNASWWWGFNGTELSFFCALQTMVTETEWIMLESELIDVE